MWSQDQREASQAAENLILSDPSLPGHDALEEAYVRSGAVRLARAMNKSVETLMAHWRLTK
jgi:hypothetical protein